MDLDILITRCGIDDQNLQKRLLILNSIIGAFMCTCISFADVHRLHSFFLGFGGYQHNKLRSRCKVRFTKKAFIQEVRLLACS